MSKATLEGSITTGLALVTAAVGSGFAGQAHAALISTVPAGFTPITLSTTSPSSVAIDLDHNGTTDYTVQSNANAVQLAASSTNSADVVKLNLNNFVRSHASVSQNDLPNYSLKTGTNSIVNPAVSPYTTFTSAPLDMALEFQGRGGAPYLGYIAGTATVTRGNEDRPASGSFTITDYGYDTSPIPEPASLALLAVGAVGVFAFRRRSTLGAA